MKTEQKFSKHIFDASTYFSELGFIIFNLLKVIRVLANKRDANLLTEKILIVISTINNCKYCKWLDARLALMKGMTEKDIQEIMKLEFQTDVQSYELSGLIYAQHFAETRGNPEAEMTEKLFDDYGNQTAKDLIIAIRTVMFGNQYFNTWDAVLSRIKGNPAPNSAILFELAFFTLNFLIIIPIEIFRKLDNAATRFK